MKLKNSTQGFKSRRNQKTRSVNSKRGQWNSSKQRRKNKKIKRMKIAYGIYGTSSH